MDKVRNIGIDSEHGTNGEAEAFFTFLVRFVFCSFQQYGLPVNRCTRDSQIRTWFIYTTRFLVQAKNLVREPI